MYHTLGQRKGLGIGGLSARQLGQKGAQRGETAGGEAGDHDAWFVARKDVAKNVLYVVQGHDHPALYADTMVAGQLNRIGGFAPRKHWVYTAKPRYRSPDAACEIDGIVNGGGCTIRFAEPQWAVTPGQSVVVYESRVCLGGGIIE